METTERERPRAASLETQKSEHRLREHRIREHRMREHRTREHLIREHRIRDNRTCEHRTRDNRTRESRIREHRTRKYCSVFPLSKPPGSQPIILSSHGGPASLKLKTNQNLTNKPVDRAACHLPAMSLSPYTSPHPLTPLQI